MHKSIGIISGKGGVGKTTIAINLAAALHALGENTLLVDANLHAPHIAHHLGHNAYINSVHDVLRGTIAPAHAIHFHDSGLKIVPGDKFTRTIDDTSRLSSFNNAANYVLYDASPGDHQHVLDAVDQVLIVTNPELPALADARRAILQAQEQNKIIAGVILNKADKKTDLNALENGLGFPIITTIERDQKFDRALQDRMIYYQIFPKEQATKAMTELAARLSNRPLPHL